MLNGVRHTPDELQAIGAAMEARAIRDPIALRNVSVNGADGDPLSSLVLLNAEDLTCRPVRWLWSGWIAAGKIHVLAGAPGTGKTTAALALAATLTRGGYWPDGSRAESGSVLVASYEDDPADTLIPRLKAAGADLTRVRFIDGTKNAGRTLPFNAREDAPLLAQAIRDHGAKLVIVDPIVSALGTFDSNKNAETRQALQPLADLAMQTDVAVLAISHFSKSTAGRDPLERVSGSLAFGAVARVVLAAAKVREEDGSTRRILTRVKSNIGPDDGGYSYTLEQVEVAPGVSGSRVTWGDALEGSARDLLAEADVENEEGASGDVVGFILGRLKSGPVGSARMEAEAEAADLSWHKVKRMSKTLGIKKVKQGMDGGWTWSLPETLLAAPKREGSAEECEESKQKSLHSSLPSGGAVLPSDNSEVL